MSSSRYHKLFMCLPAGRN